MSFTSVIEGATTFGLTAQITQVLGSFSTLGSFSSNNEDLSDQGCHETAND